MEKTTKKTSAHFKQVYPVFSIEEDKVVLKDGRIALGYSMSGAPMESWGPSQYEYMHFLLVGALQSLPVGTVVHKTDVYYDKPYQSDAREKAYFEGKTAGYFMDRLALFHRSYLFVSFPAGRRVPTNSLNTLFAGLGKTVLADPFAAVESRMEEAEALGNALAASLSMTSSVKVKRLKNEELTALYRQYFNLDFDGTPDDFTREIGNSLSGLTVGEKKVHILSLKGQGGAVFHAVRNGYHVTAPMIYPLTYDLPFPHIFTQCIRIEDTTRELKGLDNEKKINNSLQFLATQDNLLKAEEIDEFTADVRAGNKQLVSLHLAVTLFDPGDKQLKQSIERTLSAFRALNGCEAMIESLDTANLFFAHCPGNGYQVPDRWLLMPSDYAACYCNFTTTYQPDPKGDLLCDRYRNPLLVNLFNTSLNNQNCLTIGPSGSGKSYTMGNFMVQRYERSSRQIIIDVGGTYKNLMESLVGLEAYFEYDPEHPLSFNPFLLGKREGRYHIIGDKINFLVALLATIWKGTSSQVPLTPAERAIFVRIIPSYYAWLDEQPKESPSMKGFYHWFKAEHEARKGQAEYLAEMQFFNVAQFLVVLKPFVEGEYGRVLNAEREIDISDLPLVCFDMARIKSDPALYPVVSMLITELALDQVRKFPKDQKYVYMDEAWAMLSDSMGEWVETMYRTIRKNNGSICIITQGIDEIISSSVGAAIIQNAATQIILNHTDKNQVSKTATHLGFTTHEVDLIHSIRVGTNYRELFIKQGDTAKVYCLEVCPHLDAVLSSKPVERNYLRELMERYQGNIHYAANQFVEDKLLGKEVFS
jgi:conjugation system TraG family ATPase